MPLDNLNDMLTAIEGLAVDTPQGRVVPLEGVRRLMLVQHVEAAEAAPTEPPPKNMDEARAGAKKYLQEQNGIHQERDVGRAIPAQPQPSSRT